MKSYVLYWIKRKLIITTILYPIIAAVPSACQSLKGKKKGIFLSAFARDALCFCADINGFSLKELKKDTRGAPVPENGIYWSVSHKPLYVAAVCSDSPVGIDIEKILPRSEGLFNAIADNQEWIQAGERTWEFFFRLFTAKEAVVKVSGEGLKGLKRCRLKNIVDNDHLVLQYEDGDWPVEHFRVDGHIASITSFGKDVQWRCEK